MMRLSSFVVLFVLALASGRGQDQATSPSTAPGVPPVSALVVGSAKSPSFVAVGVARPPNGGELGFYFATDGERQLSAVFDASDGVPIFLSDGQQTLIYDFQQNRLVHLPTSRGFVIVEWDSASPSPLEFKFGVNWNPKLDVPHSEFRIDRFVSHPKGSLRSQETPSGTLLFTDEGSEKSVYSIEVPKTGATWFRFRSRERGTEKNFMELDAQCFDGPLEPRALAFPDLKLLGEKVPIVKPEGAGLERFVQFVRDGRAFAVKMALIMGPSVQKDLDPVLGNPDWPKITAQDKEFGTRYRDALSAQQIVFPRAGEVAPTTAPAD